MNLYEAWERRDPKPIFNVYCLPCQNASKGRYSRGAPLGSAHMTPGGVVYGADPAAAIQVLDPSAKRQALDALKSHPVHGDNFQPHATLQALVSLEDLSSDDPQQIVAYCRREHGTRPLTIEKLRQHASRSPVRARLVV